MRHIIAMTLGSLVLSALAFSVQAESGTVTIPEKVRANILKRHPKALDLQASHEIHYKRNLLEVSYKEEGSDEQILELFREDGNLFTRELLLDDISEAAAPVKEALKTHFPGYEIKKAEMIANPNGNGEEYEVYLVSGGQNWRVSLTEKGVIEQKDNY